MTKKKPSPPEDGMAQPSMAQYFTVVQHPTENKCQEKLLGIEEELVFFGGNQ